MATAAVDSTSPLKERAQNGTISRQTSPEPSRPHTQRRLRTYEGTVPTAVARRFATHDVMPHDPTSRASVTRLRTVVSTDTERQRAIRPNTPPDGWAA
jgi:hypothetical protein